MKSRNFLHVSEPLRLLVSFSQSSFPCDKACKRIFYKSAIFHPSFSRIGPIAFKGNSFFFLFCCEHISNLLNTSKFHILIISIHQSSERGLILRKLSPLQVKELQLRLLHNIRHDFKSACPSASYPMEKFQLKPDPRTTQPSRSPVTHMVQSKIFPPLTTALQLMQTKINFMIRINSTTRLIMLLIYTDL